MRVMNTGGRVADYKYGFQFIRIESIANAAKGPETEAAMLREFQAWSRYSSYGGMMLMKP